MEEHRTNLKDLLETHSEEEDYKEDAPVGID